MSRTAGEPRILIYSQRNIHPFDLWRAPHYEFEDLICQMDAADLHAPHARQPGLLLRIGNRIVYEIVRRFIQHPPPLLKPRISKLKLIRHYDMLFVFCSFPSDLQNFRLDRHWRDCFGTTICMIDEIWVKRIPQNKYYLKILSQFDQVVLYYSQSVAAVSDAIGKPCHFLPPGIDAIKFCPYPEAPERVVDVYSIGRRAEATHNKLLELANKGKFLYIYDTISGDRAKNLPEHRQLLASIAKRSRFFIVNPGLFDLLDRRGNQIEIGNRYFEGAAAGCIMIGEIPKNEVFEQLFNWPNAVIPLPFGSDQIDSVIHELNNQADTTDTMRRNNILHSLRQHDWTYRWEFLLGIAGLDPLPDLLKRKEHLEQLAASIEGKADHNT